MFLTFFSTFKTEVLSVYSLNIIFNVKWGTRIIFFVQKKGGLIYRIHTKIWNKNDKALYLFVILYTWLTISHFHYLQSTFLRDGVLTSFRKLIKIDF